jgi:hypothetical protein
MMKRIVYTRPDGGVSVTTPAREDPKFMALAMSKLPAGSTNIHVVEDSVIPKDRTFRDAWKLSGTSVDHDMAKAREIHRDHMRRVRASLLAELDIRQLRGENVETEKQVLRDVTSDPAIESASTPEELKQVWPDILK